MPKPQAAQHISCVSHGCEIWIGPPLSPEDIRALMQVHALIHYNRPITPASLFGDEEHQ